MRNEHRKLVAFITKQSAVAAIAGALVLTSQTTRGQSSAEVLEEIIVTAQFREQNVQETPIAITALSANAIIERGLDSIALAGNRIPNVTLAPGAQGFGQSQSVFIRNVGQADPHFAVEPGVGVYIDDVYYGILTGSVFELLDLDRVEVLRGPQGTLAGKNSIGGAIKLFSKQPGPEPDGYVEVGYGRYDKILARGASSFTLVEDKLYGRIAAGSIHKDGYLTRLDYACAAGLDFGTGRLTPDCKIGEEGGRAVWTARASLRWIASDRIENITTLDVTEDNSQNPAGKLLFQSPLWTGTADYITGPESYTNYETYVSRPTGVSPTGVPPLSGPYQMPSGSPLEAWGFSNTLTIDFSDTLQLTSITGYREATTTFSQQVDASPASLVDQLWRLEHDQVTQELRLSGQVGDSWEWTVGAFYYDADGFSSGRINLPGGLEEGGGGLNLEIMLSDPVATSSKSVFAHAVFHPTEKLGLTAAVRFTNDKKDFTFNRLDVNLDPHPLLGSLLNFTGAFEDDRVDYRVAIDYQLSDELMVFGQISTGFKGGGVNPRPFFVSQVQPFQPEEIIAYEIGIKSDLAQDRVRINASVFFSDFSDVQLFLVRCDEFSPFPGAPCAMTANVGDADVQGVEVEAQFRATDAFSLDLAFGYTDFEYTRIAPNVPVALDMKAIYAPDTTAVAGAQYDFNLTDTGVVTARLDYTYRSEFYAEAVNADTNLVDDVGLVNLAFWWTSSTEEWRAALRVTNLTDKFYYATKFDRSPAPNFATWGQPGAPREWLFSLTRSF
jgi:iron complex outermembrane receptor protein